MQPTAATLPRPRATASVGAVPFWLRRRPRAARPRPTPREPRWWLGVVWLLVSVLMLGFVGHIAIFGVLQHDRSQAIGYDELRTALAKAEAPVGQLGVNEEIVPTGTATALLEIPALGLVEVVREGTDPDVLRLGVGHRRDTVMPGQEGTSILYGRQSTYGGPFGGLAALVPGDEIEVTTGQGTFTFSVFGTRRPGDPLPEELADGAGRLELITADGPALIPTSVLYIDAALEGDPADTPAPVFTEKVLEPAELAMGAHHDGLSLFFSLQWLAIAAIVARWLLQRWGMWQTWIVASPTLLVLAATTADRAIGLFPNLI